VRELDHLHRFAIRHKLQAILLPDGEPDRVVLRLEVEEDVLAHAAAVAARPAGHQRPEIDDQTNVRRPVVDVGFEDAGYLRFITHFGVEPFHKSRQALMSSDSLV